MIFDTRLACEETAEFQPTDAEIEEMNGPICGGCTYPEEYCQCAEAGDLMGGAYDVEDACDVCGKLGFCRCQF